MPEISVIIPFYNRIDWLIEAIDSVLCQSYSDYELVLVNDGSSDDISALKSFTDRENVRLISQKGEGPAQARNAGVRAAKGEYIAFLDSDDLFQPEKLAMQISFMKANPDALMTHTSYQRFEQKDNPQEIIHSGRFQAGFPDIYDGCPIATPTVMLRKDVLDRVGGFRAEVRIAEDVLLWACIAREGRIVGIDQALTLVRLHGSNAAIDYRAQITGESNIIRYGLARNDQIHWYKRRKLISIKYLNIAAYYLHYRDFTHAGKNSTAFVDLPSSPRLGFSISSNSARYRKWRQNGSNL